MKGELKMSDFLDRLYANIGTKIKNFVKWSFFVEVIAILVSGLFAFVSIVADDPGMFIVALIMVPIGIIVAIAIAFVSSWAMYAFGDLVDNANQVKRIAVDIYDCIPEEPDDIDEDKPTEWPDSSAYEDTNISYDGQKRTDDQPWTCPKCRWVNPGRDTECVCGYRR